MTLRLLAACSVAVLVSACATLEKAPPAPPQVAEATPPPAPPQPRAEVGTFGFDVDGMDRSVAPGDDFFRYAVGK